jgi:hypothetical protein
VFGAVGGFVWGGGFGGGGGGVGGVCGRSGGGGAGECGADAADAADGVTVESAGGWVALTRSVELVGAAGESPPGLV